MVPCHKTAAALGELYVTDITIIIRYKKLSRGNEKCAKSFVTAGAGTACRSVAFSVTFGY
jgi:hypothetical protein